MTEKIDPDEKLQADQSSPLIDQILDDALQAVRNGQSLDLEAYYGSFPELADELRLLLPAMMLMEGQTSQLTTSGSRVESRVSASLRSPNLPVLKDYAVISEIGRGAMGVVYEAIQLPLNRRVALKVLFHAAESDNKLYRRFLREAEIGARLHHTNIVPVFEAGESDGCIYYAMQLIEGDNLLQLIEKARDGIIDQHNRPTVSSLLSLADTVTRSGNGGPDLETRNGNGRLTTATTGIDDSPATCIKLALQVAEGLHFAHQRGILHRDIKPSNIIVDREHRAWIADFGLAKAEHDAALTEANDVVGTVRYLAPERFQGNCDQRSDIYSLGVTLYELLHRRAYWPATDRAHLVQQIINDRNGGEAKRLFDCPKDVRRIIEKATQHAPACRYQSAGEMAEDLRRFLDGRPVLARRPSVLRRGYLWARRNPMISSLMMLLLLVVTVASIATAALSHRASNLQAESLRNFEKAERNLGFLLETVDKVCLSLGQDERLSRPEFQELRHQLLQMVIDFNDQFLGVTEIASETRYLSAKANVRLGSLTSGDDTLAESADYLESARRILTELHQSLPDRGEFSLELARCLRELASVEWKMGLRLGAIERLALAVELCEPLLQNDKIEDEGSFELARCQLAMGGFLSDAGSRDEAEEHFLRANEILEQMYASRPNKRSYVIELAHANLRLGQYYLSNLRYWRKAEIPLDRASELYELASKTEPGNPDFLASRSRVLFLQSRFSYIDNHRTEAVQRLQEAREIMSGLVQSHENVFSYREHYASVLQRLAQYRIYLNSIDPEIVDCFHNAADTYTWLIAHDPDNVAFKKGLYTTRIDHVELLTLRGEWQQAGQILDSAMEVLAELSFLESVDKYVQEQQYFVLCRRAELNANLQRFDESLQDWDRAIEMAPDGFRDINRVQRLRTVVLSGDVVNGIAQLDPLLEKLKVESNASQHYLGESARVLAIAHKQTLQTSNLNDAHELAEEYARRALDMLRDILEMEKLNSDFLESTEDYASLWPRADFQEILQVARQQNSLR